MTWVCIAFVFDQSSVPTKSTCAISCNPHKQQYFPRVPIAVVLPPRWRKLYSRKHGVESVEEATYSAEPIIHLEFMMRRSIRFTTVTMLCSRCFNEMGITSYRNGSPIVEPPWRFILVCPRTGIISRDVQSRKRWNHISESF